MKHPLLFFRQCALVTVALLLASLTGIAQIQSAEKSSDHLVKIVLQEGKEMYFDFYGANIFRWYYDPVRNEMIDPQSQPPAQILVDNARKQFKKLQVSDEGKQVLIRTEVISVLVDRNTLSITVVDERTGNRVVESAASFVTGEKESIIRLKASDDEYFFGGGVQNGRFSHKGKVIAIENQNSWTDGGVASPAPFFWSTGGYGFMWHTFKKGKYDFGKETPGEVRLSHETNYIDVFFMIDNTAESLLVDYYQLTGNPVLLPGFAFYEGHLNAYNRDFWKEDAKGIPFEDGKSYVESQKDNGGIKESLNGEKDNYQFSARAVVDRYAANDMPLGWILPNDGYGAGYGQTSTLDSNILNLKEFGDYARSRGVEIGLWTQSDLHPKEGISALLQRDLEKEVGVAGVRVLKTDVAWVGPGYSFGLHGIADAAGIMKKFGHDARPFIITLDGWAGTQRYGGVWTGDQTGGEWEYIRFHIPTYIGSGLSGMPNITSDMDGIFGGRNQTVNIRDFQWKAFTLMQLNMDGWGLNPKYPSALGEPATSINRNYLKLKSQLFPYTYSVAQQAVNGLPTLRATFLEEANKFTLGSATQYQFFLGPSFLVAPVYKSTAADTEGNDIRDGIYLPKGKWIDYFSGDVYTGGRVINNFEAPIWKLPVFIKPGTIIPMVNPNNNISEIDPLLRIYEVYPSGKSSFVQYDDDKRTNQYIHGVHQTTLVESDVQSDVATITVFPASGTYTGAENNKQTEFRVNVTRKPATVELTVNKRAVKLKEVNSMSDFERGSNVYYYNPAPELNRFSTPGSEAFYLSITKNPQVWVKTAKKDISKEKITLKVKGFEFAENNPLLRSEGKLPAPSVMKLTEDDITAYSVTPVWQRIDNADYYEIEFDGMLYSTIQNNQLEFEDLQPETEYHFKIRAVNKSGESSWVDFSATTKKSPFEYAINGLTAHVSAPSQPGEEIENLFDFDESTMWHTRWSRKATPFDMVIDLHTINQLDRLDYLPRDRGNGIWLKGSVTYSLDKHNWSDSVPFEWKYNGETKTFVFNGNPRARYIKINVDEARGNYGSGRELYVFKVPGTESLLPGDINYDGKVDANDLTSYLNYTGLKKGDADFEGYISKGDLNGNGIIDAFDISNVAIQLNGGVEFQESDSVAGSVQIAIDKSSFRKNDIIQITVRGSGLKNVNALSMSLPYDESDFEFVEIIPVATAKMENMTNNRLHSDGTRVLYPVFVNIGQKQTLNGDSDLFSIHLKAKKAGNFDLKAQQGLLVGKSLDVVTF
ncbi:MAG: DUF5110 domain-containing protein [Chitinophagaceae bacterium]|nr:DUF5110 domain-containing protein [Chitinophagaceae bacterium]